MMTVLETKSTENPFVYNAPVRGTDFSNRKKTIEKLMKEVVSGKSRGNVWITGERQVGKTSLLRYMQSEYEKYPGKIKLYPLPDLFSVSFIYLNVQDTESRENFYRILRQSLKNHFDFKLETKEDPFESFIEALKYLFNERKNYIVFLVDEFDAFIENLAGYDKKRATAFLAELNKLIQGVEHIKNDPKAFSCIFAANHTINELMKVNEISRRGSGLVVESMELEWFTPEQMEDLARDYLKNNAVEFSKEDLDFCFKMTQGYPYFVQKLYYILYEQKSSAPGSYLPKVKEEYGNTFLETVKDWGAANIPPRTLGKLKDLSAKILKNVGDKSMVVIFKLIEEYLKSQVI